MQSEMNLQCGGPGEGFATVSTGVGLLLGVRSDVDVQIGS